MPETSSSRRTEASASRERGVAAERGPFRLAAATAVAGSAAFLVLALLVPRAVTDDVDAAVLHTLRQVDDVRMPLGGRFVADAARDITALGGSVVLVLVVGLTAGYLLADRRRRDAMAVVLAASGGLVLDIGLKLLFSRDRPDVVPHLVTVHSGSFPSGHSMLSAVVYLTLGALLARFAKRRSTQLLPIVAAIAITFLVGCSRIILGVHYPTDVLAGWAAGAAWAAVSWLAADRAAREGKVEGRRRGAR